MDLFLREPLGETAEAPGRYPVAAVGEQDDLAEARDLPNRPWLPRFLEELIAIRDTLADLSGRLDAVASAVAGDGRDDGVTDEVNGVRVGVERIATVVAERLTDFGETLQASTRQQAAAGDENRANIEKALLDLRRSLVDSDDLVRSLLSRLDDVGTEVDRIPHATAAATADALDAAIVSLHRELVSAIETTAPAHDLELDAEPIVGPIGDVHDEVVALRAEVMAAMRARSTGAELSAVVDAGTARDALLAAVESMRADVQSLRSNLAPQQVTADDVRGLVDELTAIREEIAGLGSMRDQLATVASIRDEVAALASVRDELQPLAQLRHLTQLASMREELAQLKRRIALRATPPTLPDDQLAAIAERVSAQPRAELSDEEVRRIADVVAERLAEAFEVVDEP